ncbi:hypothetical protein KCU71_g2256, partial [Aureobasidium melanogenum]
MDKPKKSLPDWPQQPPVDENDTHHHIVPDFYAGAVEEASGDPSGWAIPEWSLDSSRHTIQKLGVQTSILSITAPGACILHGKASHELARKLNLEDARICDQEPEKFGFFANPPDLLETQAALDELQYALNVLKADRVTLFTRYCLGKLISWTPQCPAYLGGVTL